MSTPLNQQTLLEVDTNYGGTASYARVAAGITDFDNSLNEDVSKDKYMDNDGFGESEVTGAQYTISVSGHRKYGDDAQDYIFGLIFELGDSRKTQVRMTDPNGNQKTSPCTISSISPPKGAAGSKQDISFDIDCNGKPSLDIASTASALVATVAAGSVSGTTSFTATISDDGVSLGYSLTNAVQDAPNERSYTSVTAYTSGDDITASEGQSLNMYELDANGRVVLYLAEVLATADIAS